MSWIESRWITWPVEALLVLSVSGLGLAPKSLLIAWFLVCAFLADGVMLEPNESSVFESFTMLNPSLYVCII